MNEKEKEILKRITRPNCFGKLLCFPTEQDTCPHLADCEKRFEDIAWLADCYEKKAKHERLVKYYEKKIKRLEERGVRIE